MPAPAIPPVADLMATSLPTVSGDTPAFEVAARMERERLRHVLVVEGHALAGLVDRAALLRYLIAYAGTEGPDRDIRGLMITEPITITPDATAVDAIRRMRFHRIGSLPVVEQGVLVGLISERRLMLFVEALIADATR